MIYRLTYLLFSSPLKIRIDQNNEHPRHYRHVGHVKDAGLKNPEIDVHKIGYRAVDNTIIHITDAAAQNEDDTQQRIPANVVFYDDINQTR